MPRLRRRGNIGRRTRHSQIMHTLRLNITEEDTSLGDQVANRNANERQEHRYERLRSNTLRQRQARQRTIDEDRGHAYVLRALTGGSLFRLAFECAGTLKLLQGCVMVEPRAFL